MTTAKVPQTFLLEEAAMLARGSMFARLDPALDYQPFFRLDLGGDVPEARHASWDYCDMSGRFVDALILTGPMTGTTGLSDAEAGLRAFLLGRANHRDGLFYDAEAPWSRYAADMFCQGRVLLGLVSWFLLTGDQAIQDRIEVLIRGLIHIADWRGSACSYPKDVWIEGRWENGGLWNGTAPGYAAQQLIGLARYGQATGSASALRLSRGLARHFVDDGSVVAPDGSFRGHTHSQGILPATIGVLAYALLAADEDLAHWSRRVYEFARRHSSPFGWVPDGMLVDPAHTPYARTCETCSLADMLELAIKLTEAGLGDYWDDIERFARNQLLEQQIRDVDRTIPLAMRKRSPTPVEQMVRGAFDSAAHPNSLLGDPNGVVEGCCTPAGARACFLVWDRVMTRRADGVYVNLAFSRDTPWARLSSFEPYRGELRLEIREALPFYVRIPEWADRDRIRLTIDGRRQGSPLRWRGRWLALGDAQPGQTVAIAYPQRSGHHTHTLADRHYTTQWKGGSVIRIQPTAARYPIYDRTNYETTEPPMVEREVSIQPTVVTW